MAPRLREQYEGEVVPALMQEFKYSSPMQVPRLQKAVLNIGLGEALQNNKALDAAVAAFDHLGDAVDLNDALFQLKVIRVDAFLCHNSSELPVASCQLRFAS
jgi:hypothetical protein